jgi:hypothetical protein
VPVTSQQEPAGRGRPNNVDDAPNHGRNGVPSERVDRAALTEQALGAGKAWKEISVLLNEAGVRPPRGKLFTPVQIRLLYLREHRLKSFRLAGRPGPKETGT